MKNIERLAKFVTKNGTEDIMVHTIAGTANWLVAQKMEKDKWLLTMANPMGNVTYNLGMVNDKQHFELWVQLTKLEIEKKTSHILLAKQLTKVVKNFLKDHGKSYKKFTKVKKQRCFAYKGFNCNCEDCKDKKQKKMHHMRKNNKKVK